MQTIDSLALISSEIPDVIIDLRYKYDRNIAAKPLYKKDYEARLRKDVLGQLKFAAEKMRELGYRIVIWDAYRTKDVQKILRSICTDERYVATDSNHTKGIGLDMTLAKTNGEYLDMGTDHDDFSEKSHSGFRNLSAEQLKNREILSQLMKTAGFSQNKYEWWHFDFVGTNKVIKFNYKTGQAFFDNKFVPFKDASLSIGSSPVLYGLSVYTTSSANWNVKEQKLYIFRLQDHYKRLVDSAKIMDFQQFIKDWPYERFEQTILELLSKNAVKEDVLIRTTVFVDEILAGTKMTGLKNSLSSFVYPLGEFLPLTGAHACVSSWKRTPDNAIPSRAKVNGSYANASLMKNEALLNGYDEAISLDENGHVAEGTVANLFIVRDGVLITPDSATDILEGITRDSIFRLAKKAGIDCQERTVDRSELYIADEIFMCGSSARITPILSVDRRQIGAGSSGLLTRKLMKIYEAAQRGTDSSFADWRQAV